MEFVCKLGTAAGHVTTQTEQATSEGELRQRLLAEGYYVFSVEPRGGLRSQAIALRRRKISPDDFLIFNQQFLTLSKSGLPLQKSLELLIQHTRSDQLQAGLDTVGEQVRARTLLSEAFDG